jgi:hypothetical protein
MNIAERFDRWLGTFVNESFNYYAIGQKDENLEIWVFIDPEDPIKFVLRSEEAPILIESLRAFGALRTGFAAGLPAAIEVFLKLPQAKDRPRVFIFKKNGPDQDTIEVARAGRELTLEPMQASDFSRQ